MLTDERLRGFLGRVVRQPMAHARWLNTVSMLEYTGARKILKSQASATLSETMLQHASEEIRHAHFFKRAAMRITEDAPDDYAQGSLCCGEQAKAYFYQLDHGTHQVLKGLDLDEGQLSYVTYLCVTLLIEERAMWLYPIYDEVLRQTNQTLRLRSVIAEEEGHLEDLQRELKRFGLEPSQALTDLRALETQLFTVFFQALEAWSSEALAAA